jgi:hypothetical protein
VPLYDAVFMGDDRPGIMGIADFDGDGLAEIYYKNQIHSAETGALLAQGTGDWETEVNSAPVAVNILPSTPNLELVSGGIIYSVPDLSNRNPASPINLTVAADINDLGAQFYPKELFDPVEYGLTNYSSTSVADMNGDGHIDVVLSGARGSSTGNTAIYFWDVYNNTYSYFEPPDPIYPGGWPWGTSRPNLGDANGDGQMDIVFIAGNQLFALTLDAGGNLVPLWPAPRIINDSRSGIVAVTIYDFDNDGNPEVVYRDSQQLVIVDGATGQDVKWSTVCQSHTMTEGPIIADVDGDGGTDITVPCYFSKNSFDINAQIQQQALGTLSIFYSSENLWLPTRKVWNQPGYFVVNINDDLTVPRRQMDQGVIYGEDPCSNGIPGPVRPFNIFLNQTPTISADGCPFYPAPDVSFVGDNPNAQPGDPDYKDPSDPSYFPAVNVIPPICGDLGIEVEFNIINDGSLTISSTIPVSFWDGDPTVDPVPAQPATLLYQEDLVVNDFRVGDTISISGVVFNSTGKAFRLFIVLNDDGTVLPAGQGSGTITECKLDNNVYYFDIIPDPFEVDIEKIQDNIKCEDSAPDNGELRAVITRNGVEVLDYSDFAFQWYDDATATNAIPAPGGTSNVLTGLPEGDYSLIVTNTDKGCASIPTDTSIVRIGVDPEITIVENSPQSHCVPPNGELEVFITGGNAGFTFEWFDRFFNPIGITGSVASNLTAGEYIVSVFKDGCTKTGSYTLNGPIFPVVQTSLINDITDCANLNSGKITAEAMISGIPQDSTNYTFNWYEWDPTANDLGTILPPVHGTGPTRSGLPAGEYAVVVRDDITGCESDPPIRQIIQDLTVFPTITMAELSPQTSCDPANPNGQIMAEGYINGILQNAADLTFEWFEGDNTLPANLITDVSGINGEIANGIAGGGLPYTVRVTTMNNCSSTLYDTISDASQIPVVTAVPFDNNVCGPTLSLGGIYTGRVEASAVFNGLPVNDYSDYTYTWFDGEDTGDPVLTNTSPDGDILYELNAGRYTVILERNSLNCISDPVTVEIFDDTTLPVINVSEVPATNCVDGNPNGELIASVDVGGTPTILGHSFQWFEGTDVTASGTPVSVSGGINNEIALQLTANSTYTVLVTNDTTGCQSTLSYIVSDNSDIPVLSLSMTPNSICDPAVAGVAYNGTVTGVTTYNGAVVADFSDYYFNLYEGSDTTGVLNGTVIAAVADFTALDSGFYTMRAYNTALGCYSDPVTIEVLEDFIIPAINLTEQGATNCDPALPNGILTADVGGFVAGYTFKWVEGLNVNDPQWSPVSGTADETAEALAAGDTYTVKVTTDATGCFNTLSRVVSDSSELPVVSLSMTSNSICDPVVAMEPYNGTISGLTTYQGAGVSDYTDYYFNLYEGNDTTGILNGTVTAAAANFIELDSGFYTMRAYNTVLGCYSDPVSIEVTEDFIFPTISITEQGATNCDPNLPNGVFTADAGGLITDYTFKWVEGLDVNDPEWAPVNGIENETAEALVVGDTYTVKVTTDTTGCFSTQSRILSDSSEVPVLSLVQTPNTICDDVIAGAFDGTITGTMTYYGNPVVDFSPFDFNLFEGTDTTGVILQPISGLDPNFIELQEGEYTVKAYDFATGCYSDPVTIEVLDNTVLPNILITQTPNASCDNSKPIGTIQAYVDVIGNIIGHSFTWHDGGTTGDPVLINDYEVIDLPGNQNYTVEVVNDTTGCVNSLSTFLNRIIPTYDLSIAITDIDDCNNGGSILATVDSSGTGPVADYANYEFYWYKGDIVNPDSLLPETSRNLTDILPKFNLFSEDYTVYAINTYTHCLTNDITGFVAAPDPLFEILSEINFYPSDCQADSGAITSWVNNVGIRDYNYNFYWYEGRNINPGSNFYTYPPVAFNGPILNNDFPSALPYIGSPQPNRNAQEGPTIYNLGDGVYSVVVEDRNSGCLEYIEVALPSIITPPTLLGIVQGSTLCPYTIGNGIVEAAIHPDSLVSQGLLNSDYEFSLFEGISTDTSEMIGAPLFGAPDQVSFTQMSNLLAPGFYTIVAEEQVSGSFCPSVPLTVEILPLALPPIVDLASDLIHNTSCDSTVVNGQIELDISKDPADSTVDSTYELIWDSTASTIPSDTSGVSEGDVGPFGGLNNGTYEVTVIDENSTCETTETYVLYNTPPEILVDETTLVVTDKYFCVPSGHIEIVDISVGGVPDSLNNFTYEWYDGAGNLASDTPIGAPAITPRLDSITFATIHDGMYYVVVTKDPAAGGDGAGCESAPFNEQILDRSIDPTILLSPGVNLACDSSFATGTLAIEINTGGSVASDYEFTIKSTALAVDSISGYTGPTGTYSEIHLGPGVYEVTVRDEDNECRSVASRTIEDHPSIPYIEEPDLTILDQLICTNDGSISVDSIRVNGLAEIPGTDSLAGEVNYVFTWYEDQPLMPDLGVGGNVLDTTTYPQVEAGVFYFTALRRNNKHEPGEGCETAPFAATIDDISEDPLLALSMTANQSCDTAVVANGTITAVITPGLNSADRFNYTWSAFPTDRPAEFTAGTGSINEIFNDRSYGQYTLEIEDEDTRCRTTGSITVANNPFIPIIDNTDFLVNDQSVCFNDGSVIVFGIFPGDTSQYDFEWFEGFTNLNNNISIAGVTDGILDTTTYASVQAGDYYFTATNIDPTLPIGFGCETAPVLATINDVSVDPVLNLLATANENCDLSFANGTVLANATTAGVPGPSYSYTLNSSVLGAPVDSLFNDAQVLYDSLRPGTYNVLVVDDNTLCESNRSITVNDRPVFIEITDVSYAVTDQFICAPDGSIIINNIVENGVPQNLIDYSYVWYQGEGNLNTGNSIAGVSDAFLDTTNFATIGAGDYFFTVTKLASAARPGVGCESAPLRADIFDQHTNPNVIFNLITNTSCDPSNPNGEVFATAFENDGTDTDIYTFVWTYNGGALPAGVIQNDSMNISQLMIAPEGQYQIIVTNSSRTQCNVNSSTTLDIDEYAEVPNIIIVDVTDPLYCYPTGALEVTEITVGGQPANVSDFEYDWYQSNFTPGDLILDSLGNPIVSPLLSDIYPDTYYVIARDTITKCESIPKEAMISDANIVYPVIHITQTAPQTSCDPMQPNASLSATADGNDDTNPDYQFAWFNSLDASGPFIATTSAIYGLGADNYSVSVFNIVTGCASSDYYITEDDILNSLPIVSVAASPQTNCIIDDGLVSAEVINYTGNFQFDWYIGDGVGIGPDFTGQLISGLPPGLYTVTATELDTTYCTSEPVVVEVKDERMSPNVMIEEDNPLTNCWVTDPNGQFSATVNGVVGGYIFEWYVGTDTTGIPDHREATYSGLAPQTYTLVVTDINTNCSVVESVDLTDSTIAPPVADPEVVQHLLSCIELDGWVRASVGGNVIDYTFYWYNGSSAGNSSDWTGINYRDLDAGFYTVTAQDIITGCISEGVPVEVLDQREIPLFDFNVVNAHCEQVDGSVEIVWENDVPIGSTNWYDTETGQHIETGSAIYNYPPGVYEVVVTTVYGCEEVKEAEIGYEIYEFNGISANGDGRNDYFDIACISEFPDNHVRIFNRAGQLVFEAFGYDNLDVVFTGIGENGMYLAGRELPDGTYFYIIDKGDGTEPIAGYLELIR